MEILFEDKDLIVCHKPSGIPVQSARIGQKDMVSILNNYLAEKGSSQKIFVVHRLDQPVEGVIVFAKTKRAASELSRQIVEGKMKKVYQAVCCVTEKGQKFLEKKEVYVLEDYLAKNGRTNTSSVVGKNSKEARYAELAFEVLDSKENPVVGSQIYLLVRIELKTGRHHQIRVQMSHAGLPLFGDQKYHENWMNYVLEKQKEEEDSLAFGSGRIHKKTPSLALCSASLSFRHPVTGKEMKFETRPTTEAFLLFEKQAFV